MNQIAETLFITMALVIGSGIIIGLIIAVDERKKMNKDKFDEHR
jgi:hypothetical protein